MAVLRAEFNVNSFQLKFLVDLFRGGPTQVKIKLCNLEPKLTSWFRGVCLFNTRISGFPLSLANERA